MSRDIVARCPQCCGGMQESTDAEGGVQAPVESGFTNNQLPDMESYRKQENSMAEGGW